MGNTPEKIQWHPAFYAATELELQANIEQLELKREYNLSKEPIRIDLLIINNVKKEQKLKNEIGHIMRRYNVIEYKSPTDNLSIDDFYKTLGYACLLKGYGKNVNHIPSTELTISLFHESYPRKMLLTIMEEGHTIEEKYPGIYYIHGFSFPVQVVVIKQLRSKEHKSLKILTTNANRNDVKVFLQETEAICSPRERQNIDAVLQASVRANYELYETIRRESTMCEALRELMKDEIEKDVNAAKEIAMAEGREIGIAQGKELGIAQGKELGIAQGKELGIAQGKELGIAQGMAQGITQGKELGIAEIICAMHKNGSSPDQIASLTGKDLTEINAILSSEL